GATVLGTAPVNAGVATLNHTFTTDGSHSITAVYSGDATNRTSTSAASTVEVSTDVVVADTTTTLNAPATAKTGTAVDLTATVAPAGATGTVDFRDGATVLGTAPVNAGVATLNHTFTTNGSHSITAVYSGDATNRTSTSAASTVEVSTDVVVADTTTTLNVPGAATTGDSVELFALVAGNDNTPAEGGTVQFSIDGSNVGGAIAVTGGSAKLDHVFAAGSHSVGAVYSGTTTFNGSTATAASIVVTDPAPVELTTVTTLTAPATATKGAAVNLSASVKTEAGDPVTSGTVTFMDGTTAIGTAVNVVNGQATLSYPFALTGDRHITAVYSGASGLKESTSVASTVTVSAGSTNPGGTGSLSWLGNIFGS
ncbi:Ig-like domain-containing protein, partial [Rhodococcus sp. ARC_M6]|uniref:Ig-like domain-containing protein n=1 Tax=Rhodococcus sp. ARC_M6 TaxID=2928852 RepID=UPI001FB29ABD